MTPARPQKSRQLELLKNEPSAYGGDLLKTRKGRARARPLSTRSTMHLVLRSSKARGEWSFRKPRHAQKIKEICDKFARKHGVQILSLANVGNHLHFHLKLGNRHTYRKFIRAVTAAIAMAVTGACRWRPLRNQAKDDYAQNDVRWARCHGNPAKDHFWDYRPFTRVVQGFRAFLSLRDYIHINQLEGFGYRREEARSIVAYDRALWTQGSG